MSEMLKPCLKCKEKRKPKDFNPKEKLYCLGCRPLRKSRAAVSVLEVNFDREQKRLLTVLHRDIQRLMDRSHTGQLTKDDSGVLVNYIKLVGELRAIKLFEDADKETK